MRLLSAIKYDVKFQFRHGFYYAYLLIILLYVLFLRLLPLETARYISSLIVFSDPSVLGFFFIGGIVLLERDQNIYESLFVTPFRVREYIISKCLSLTLLGLISSLGVVMLSFGLKFNLIPIIIGVVLTSMFFTLVGLILGAYSKTLNGYISSSPVLVIFLLPLLEHFNIYSTPLFYILPGKGSLILIEGAFMKITLGNAVVSSGILILWILIAYITANRIFYKKVVLGAGGENN